MQRRVCTITRYIFYCNVICIIIQQLLALNISNTSNSLNTSNATNITNITNITNVTNDTIVEIEVLPEYQLPKLEYQLTPEQKYTLYHYDDPNEFVQEYKDKDIPYQINKEQNALKTFYHSTNGIYWLKNWDFTNV